MTEQMGEQMSLFDHDTWCGRMSREHSVPTRAETSRPSSRKSSGSSSRMQMMCLCLRKESGPTPDVFVTTWGGWSVAWRVHDAQFWGPAVYSDDGVCLQRGTPQRRKRIALVADFGGFTAPEVLFERESLSGHFDESGTERQDLAPGTKGSPGSTISFQERAGKPGGGKGILIQEEHVGALSTLNNQSVLDRPIPIHDKATRFQGGGKDRHNDGGGNGFGVGKPDDPTWALSTAERHSVFAIEGNGSRESHKGPGYAETETMYTLNAVEQHGVCRTENI